MKEVIIIHSQSSESSESDNNKDFIQIPPSMSSISKKQFQQAEQKSVEIVNETLLQSQNDTHSEQQAIQFESDQNMSPQFSFFQQQSEIGQQCQQHHNFSFQNLSNNSNNWSNQQNKKQIVQQKVKKSKIIDEESNDKEKIENLSKQLKLQQKQSKRKEKKFKKEQESWFGQKQDLSNEIQQLKNQRKEDFRCFKQQKQKQKSLVKLNELRQLVPTKKVEKQIKKLNYHLSPLVKINDRIQELEKQENARKLILENGRRKIGQVDEQIVESQNARYPLFGNQSCLIEEVDENLEESTNSKRAFHRSGRKIRDEDNDNSAELLPSKYRKFLDNEEDDI